jgi:signal transduction histidine kinase/tetratricopeptide (TPR) repeat protein
MKISSFLIILFVVLTNVLMAQNAQDLIDQLKAELKTNPDEKRKATVYSDLTWHYSSVSTDSALVYGGKALDQSIKNNDSTLIAQVYSDLGAVYFRRDNLEVSKQHYLKALKIREILKDGNGISKLHMNIANIYQAQENFKPATESYLKVIDYFQSNNNLKALNVAKGNLASLFFKMKNYPKALKYLTEAIDYEESTNLSGDLCKNYLTLGNVYFEMKDTVQAKTMYDKSLAHCTEVGDKYTISSIYNNLGIIKASEQQSEEAKKLFDDARKYREDLHSDIYKAKLDLNLADEYISKKDFVKARFLLDNMRIVFEEGNSKANLVNTYKGLIVVHAYLGQPDSSLYYSKKLTALETDIFEMSAAAQNNELEAQYETAKKEKLILEQEAQAKQKNIWLILACGIGAIGLLLFRQQRIKTRQQQEKAVIQNQLLQEQANYKMQEQRLNISRELHDSVGAQLTFILSILDNLKAAPTKLESAIETKIESLTSYANSSISELRDTIWVLNAENLTLAELKARILNFVKDAKDSVDTVDFQFDYSIKNNRQLTSKQGMNLFRVVQETVNNAIKHAEATQIKISISDDNDQIKLLVSDNGKGFDYEEKKKRSYGLSNLKQRIEEIGGSFQFNSEANKGTQLSVQIQLAL